MKKEITPSDDVQMSVKATSKDIIIRIPISLLRWAQENREDELKIKNKKDMADWVVDNILDWGGNADLGSTAFEDFLDAMFIDALEGGEEWLDADWDDRQYY